MGGEINGSNTKTGNSGQGFQNNGQRLRAEQIPVAETEEEVSLYDRNLIPLLINQAPSQQKLKDVSEYITKLRGLKENYAYKKKIMEDFIAAEIARSKDPSRTQTLKIIAKSTGKQQAENKKTESEDVTRAREAVQKVKTQEGILLNFLNRIIRINDEDVIVTVKSELLEYDKHRSKLEQLSEEGSLDTDTEIAELNNIIGILNRSQDAYEHMSDKEKDATYPDYPDHVPHDKHIQKIKELLFKACDRKSKLEGTYEPDLSESFIKIVDNAQELSEEKKLKAEQQQKQKEQENFTWGVSSNEAPTPNPAPQEQENKDVDVAEAAIPLEEENVFTSDLEASRMLAIEVEPSTSQAQLIAEHDPTDPKYITDQIELCIKHNDLNNLQQWAIYAAQTHKNNNELAAIFIKFQNAKEADFYNLLIELQQKVTPEAFMDTGSVISISPELADSEVNPPKDPSDIEAIKNEFNLHLGMGGLSKAIEYIKIALELQKDDAARADLSSNIAPLVKDLIRTRSNGAQVKPNWGKLQEIAQGLAPVLFPDKTNKEYLEIIKLATPPKEKKVDKKTQTNKESLATLAPDLKLRSNAISGIKTLLDNIKSSTNIQELDLIFQNYKSTWAQSLKNDLTQDFMKHLEFITAKLQYHKKRLEILPYPNTELQIVTLNYSQADIENTSTKEIANLLTRYSNDQDSAEYKAVTFYSEEYTKLKNKIEKSNKFIGAIKEAYDKTAALLTYDHALNGAIQTFKKNPQLGKILPYELRLHEVVLTNKETKNIEKSKLVNDIERLRLYEKLLKKNKDSYSKSIMLKYLEAMINSYEAIVLEFINDSEDLAVLAKLSQEIKPEDNKETSETKTQILANIEERIRSLQEYRLDRTNAKAYMEILVKKYTNQKEAGNKDSKQALHLAVNEFLEELDGYPEDLKDKVDEMKELVSQLKDPVKEKSKINPQTFASQGPSEEAIKQAAEIRRLNIDGIENRIIKLYKDKNPKLTDEAFEDHFHNLKIQAEKNASQDDVIVEEYYRLMFKKLEELGFSQESLQNQPINNLEYNLRKQNIDIFVIFNQAQENIYKKGTSDKYHEIFKREYEKILFESFDATKNYMKGETFALEQLSESLFQKHISSNTKFLEAILSSKNLENKVQEAAKLAKAETEINKENHIGIYANKINAALREKIIFALFQLDQQQFKSLHAKLTIMPIKELQEIATTNNIDSQEITEAIIKEKSEEFEQSQCQRVYHSKLLEFLSEEEKSDPNSLLSIDRLETIPDEVTKLQIKYNAHQEVRNVLSEANGNNPESVYVWLHPSLKPTSQNPQSPVKDILGKHLAAQNDILTTVSKEAYRKSMMNSIKFMEAVHNLRENDSKATDKLKKENKNPSQEQYKQLLIKKLTLNDQKDLSEVLNPTMLKQLGEDIQLEIKIEGYQAIITTLKALKTSKELEQLIKKRSKEMSTLKESLQKIESNKEQNTQTLAIQRRHRRTSKISKIPRSDK